MDRVNNYYALLGVSRTESLEGIHRAYRRLAKEYHPDHAGGQGTEKFQAIHEAYEVLSDADRRKEYDKLLRRHTRPPIHAAEPLVRPTPPRSRPEPFMPRRREAFSVGLGQGMICYRA